MHFDARSRFALERPERAADPGEVDRNDATAFHKPVQAADAVQFSAIDRAST